MSSVQESGVARVCAVALVLDEELAAPEEVDGALVAFEVGDIRLEGGEGGAAEAEDVEELVPEGLLLGALGAVASVVAGEADGAVADFVPGKVGHDSGRLAAGLDRRGRFCHDHDGGR